MVKKIALAIGISVLWLAPLDNVWACMEKPKSFAFSSMESFKGAVDMSFGVNCAVQMILSDAKKEIYVRYPSPYDIKQGSKAEICVLIFQKEDRQAEPKKICGESLRKVVDELTLKDSNGKAVGKLFVDANGKLIISDVKTSARISVDIKDDKTWNLAAEEKSGSVSGKLDLVSHDCTRGMPAEGKGEIDLKGKHYASTEGGCASGLDLKGDFKPEIQAKGVLSVDGQDVE